MRRFLLAVAMVSAWSNQVSAQYSNDTIKIGVLTDMSGVYADMAGAGSVWAAKKAINDFGASAKGMKVEVIVADHQNKPDIAANIARQWYDVEKVDVITDLVTSSAALAVNQITRDKNKVALFTATATSDLTGKACSPNSVHWTFDTWALANSTANALVGAESNTWFFLTMDNAAGLALERDAAAVVTQHGGKILGKVRHPLGATDFASFLLQAQASKAKVIALANAGGDTINSVKQAAEFGIVEGGQRLVATVAFITDIHSLGLKIAQGLLLTEAWYWDMTEENRKFAAEYASAHNGMYPTMVHAGTYSAVMHYLKAVEALKSDADGVAVVAKMKTMPSNDKLFGEGTVREDGRHTHPMYLFEVKKPRDSRGPWDYYNLRRTIPAAEAFRPLDQSECPIMKK